MSYSDPTPTAPVPDLVDIDQSSLNDTNGNNNNNINVFLSPTSSSFPVVWPINNSNNTPSVSTPAPDSNPVVDEHVPTGRTLSHAIF
jgi:hypothetical protein